MILSTHRPYFAPYPGFFQKMHLSDVMVILDDVQFPRRTTWITRNRFKNDGGTLWMTVPVRKKGLGLQKIMDVRICGEGNWRYKHLKSIRTAYRHAPWLQVHDAWLESAFSLNIENIAAFNLKIIDYLKEYLQIDTRLVCSSKLGLSKKGTLLLVELCTRMGASTYLAQAGADKYLDVDMLANCNIQVAYFKPVSRVYPQLWGNFIPDLSTLDVIFNCGEKARHLVLQ